jgi:hypothetical protein
MFFYYNKLRIKKCTKYFHIVESGVWRCMYSDTFVTFFIQLEFRTIATDKKRDIYTDHKGPLQFISNHHTDIYTDH